MARPLHPAAAKFRILTVLIAYFDESTHGQHAKRKSSAYAMRGYVSTEKEWAEFERGWRKLLRDFHIEVFHMTDFESNQKQFKGWSVQRHKRFADRMASLVERSKLIGILCGVYIDDYEYILDTVGNASSVLPSDIYLFCFQTCIGFALDEILNIPHLPKDEQISFVFDRKGKGPGVPTRRNTPAKIRDTV